jgi:hypothetical protein
METTQELLEAQNVTINNLLTAQANINQALSLYLSQLAVSDWGYKDEEVKDLQFKTDPENKQIIVLEPTKQRKKKNK